MIYQNSRYSDSTVDGVETANGTHQFIVPAPLNLKAVGGYLRHTVRAGDRLDWLATRYLHNPQMWWAISAVNPGVAMPEGLTPGDTLLIPVL